MDASPDVGVALDSPLGDAVAVEGDVPLGVAELDVLDVELESLEDTAVDESPLQPADTRTTTASSAAATS